MRMKRSSHRKTNPMMIKAVEEKKEKLAVKASQLLSYKLLHLAGFQRAKLWVKSS
jgi:hypothetical protein